MLPGRLSVSRTFGDIEAKLEKLGGNPKVVVCKPDIKSFKIQDNHDFIILASKNLFLIILRRRSLRQDGIKIGCENCLGQRKRLDYGKYT